MIEIELPESWRGRALVIRDVDDPESWLRDDELAVVREFKRERRRKEWMLARIAAKELARRRGLTDDPRSFVVARPLVSISHSGPYAAAAIDAGVDVEVVRDVSERAAKHFLTSDESAAMQRCTIAHRLLHFWCAKEAAWKRRGGAITLLRDVPLRFVREEERGVVFEEVETFATGDVIAALAPSESSGPGGAGGARR